MPYKILVVDDEPDMLKLIKYILEIDKGDYEIMTAVDGKDALTRVKTFTPDLIILDEMIPIICGNDVAKIIKSDEKIKHIPIIMVSARYLTKDKIKSILEAGVDDYLVKPFEPDELRARIKSMLRIKQLTDDLKNLTLKLEKMYEQASITADIRKKILDDVLHGFPFAIVVLEYPDIIIEANSNLFDMLSLTQNQIIGKKFSEIFGVNIDSCNSRPITIEFFDNYKGKLYLDLHYFCFEDSNKKIVLLQENTENIMMRNVRNIFRTAMAEGRDGYEFFKKFLIQIKTYFFSEFASIHIFDEENIYSIELDDPNSKKKFSLKDIEINIDVIKNAMHHKISYVIGKDLEHYFLRPQKDIFNIVKIPLRGIENKIGIMLLYNCHDVEKSFEYKIEIIEFLVDIVGILYENILLMTKLHRENILVRSLISISQVINSTIDYRKLLIIFAEAVAQFMSSKTVGIFLFNKATHELELVHQIGISQEKILRYAESKIKRSELEIENGNPSEILKNHPKFSIFASGVPICLFPLIIRHRLIGFLYIEKEETDKIKIELMTLLAEFASKSIENAYLFDQVLKQNEQLIETTEILKRTEQKLILNEKLAAMGQFATTVAHEIRNPLTIMLGALQALKKATPEEKEQILTHLESKIIDIDHILKQMMEFTKPMNLSFSEFNPDEAIKSTINFISKKAEGQNVKVITELRVNKNIKADKMWFERIILNLIINALDEMKDGGILTIKTFIHGDELNVKVIDTGKGIPEQVAASLFEPFNTSKRTGSGLGLYNVKKAIELHGGKISFETGSSGTTFTIVLPMNNY